MTLARVHLSGRISAERGSPMLRETYIADDCFARDQQCARVDRDEVRTASRSCKWRSRRSPLRERNAAAAQRGPYATARSAEISYTPEL